MPLPRRLLPSMSALQAFDAAARTGSFSAAARELNLTQGAVSRQIRTLEEQLAVALFTREKQAVTLTQEGRSYARSVNTALQNLRSAALHIMTDPKSGVLNLGILPTFGMRWLVPRIPLFLETHPGITLNFVTHVRPFDFSRENLDAAIHFGDPDWPDADCVFLMKETALPLCAPSFLADRQISSPEDLLNMPLLHIATRPLAWAGWFAAQGLTPGEDAGMQFEQYTLVSQAAVAGLGVALLPEFLVRSELERGDLICPLDRPIESEQAYYLVIPKDRSDSPPVQLFKTWLLNQIRE
ncbi:LysR family transcriptional regulator [Rhodovibrionaceae bacterium A322]